MTYCLALKLNQALVLLSDTRTNAGFDDISRFRKTFTWERRGERAVAVMTAGNLGMTQGVISHLQSCIDAAERGEEVESILSCPTLYRGAELVGQAMQAIRARDRPLLEAAGHSADASLIFAGQRRGGALRLFMIYSAGNFMEATDESPFLQIGEHKYGKPILDRVVDASMPLQDALKAAMLSMDATMRSNLSVGMPLDLTVIRRDQFIIEGRRFDADDPICRQISDVWAGELRKAFQPLPDIPFN
jgi:putative proteasome-type protease